MTDTTAPRITVTENELRALFLAGIAVAGGAFYYTGATGNWVPSMAASIALCLLVLFVDSE